MSGKAVVIGGGLAGLAAARRLQQQGWHVLVLEQQSVVGGRCRSERAGPYSFDAGAQYYHDSFDEVLSTAVGLGLGETMRMPQDGKGIYHHGRAVPFTPRTANPFTSFPWRAAGPRAWFDVPAVTASVLRHYRNYNIRFPEQWTYGDAITAAQHLAHRSGADYRKRVADPVAAYWDGCTTGELSAAALMVALRCTFADRTGSFTGGMGSLAEAMAAGLTVKTEMRATEVVMEGRRVKAVRAVPAAGGRARSYPADFVVSAVPAATVVELAPRLGRAARAVIGRTAYTPCVVACLAFERDPGGPAGPLLLPRHEGFRAGWTCTSRSKALEQAPAGGLVISLVFSGEEAATALDREDESVIAISLQDAAKAYGTAKLVPAATRVYRHSLGLPVVSPEHAARVRALRESGSGIAGLALAGDWTASPTTEGAVSSGVGAAAQAPGASC